MDADCLIKVTKAGLKGPICQQYEVVIPLVVKREVVDAGKVKDLADADLVEKNIARGIIRVAGKESSLHMKGDQALLENFKRGSYDMIATDDAKLIKSLRSAGIPHVMPGLLIYLLCQRKRIDKHTGLEWLDGLSGFISEDEYSMVRLLLEEKS